MTQADAITERQRIGDTQAAVALLGPIFAGLDHEEVRVLLLDSGLALLKLCAIRGAASHVELSLRPVLRDALVAEAQALILAHNHPCGDPSPSAADRNATRRLVEVARPLGIRVLDHLVFAGATVASFREMGLL